jgi:catechol 2,3-dioxygenase-like lactoylglutathione lyase family enzyme
MRSRLVGLACLALMGAGCAASEEIVMVCTMNVEPLKGSSIMGFAVTTDAEACRAFYSGKLGLRVVEEDAMAIMFESEGGIIRIQKGTTHEPRPYTVLGWRVPNMRTAVARLAAAGVVVERYEWMAQQDKSGVATFPNGDMVAWFKDPDGNVLSVAQLVK